MNQQNVPLLYRVVLLYGLVIGIGLTILQIITITMTTNVSTIAMPAVLPSRQVIKQIQNPTRLQIERIGVNVPLQKGVYNTQQNSWELSSDHGHYVPYTEQNLLFIYGHNTPTVFELTNSLQPGDVLALTMPDKTTKQYRYISDYLTNPTDVSILTKTYDQPTLALLTCNGFWSQDRRFMFFVPVEGN